MGISVGVSSLLTTSAFEVAAATAKAAAGSTSALSALGSSANGCVGTTTASSVFSGSAIVAFLSTATSLLVGLDSRGVFDFCALVGLRLSFSTDCGCCTGCSSRFFCAG